MDMSQQTGSNYQLTSVQVSSNLPESTKIQRKKGRGQENERFLPLVSLDTNVVIGVRQLAASVCCRGLSLQWKRGLSCIEGQRL